jgi:hypothetical protein
MNQKALENGCRNRNRFLVRSGHNGPKLPPRSDDKTTIEVVRQGVFQLTDIAAR